MSSNLTTVPLRSVCRMDRRATPASKAQDLGLDFVGMEQVDPASGSITTGAGSRTGDGKSQVFLFDQRHVLFGKLRPYLRKIARPRTTGCASTELVPLLPDAKRLDRDYLFHWLRQPAVVDVLTAKSSGARMPRADMALLLDMSLPLPSLEEQRRIVDRLDRATSIWRRAEAARAKARAIIPALFHDMFGDPATNPMDWPLRPLAELATIGSGLTKGKKIGAAPATATPYLRVANVQADRLDLTEIKLIDATEPDRKKFRLKYGDLLMTEGGDPDKLGRCAIWRAELELCLHQNHIFRVRMEKSMNRDFTRAFMQCEAARSYFFRVAKRTTGIASINKSQLSQLPVWTPPLPLQKSFAEQAERLENIARALDAAALKAKTLAAALSAESFDPHSR